MQFIPLDNFKIIINFCISGNLKFKLLFILTGVVHSLYTGLYGLIV